MERSRPGRRTACRAAEGYRSTGVDTRADANPRAAARAPGPAQAHQPAQRLPPHRHRRVHPARCGRVVGPARGHAFLRGRGTHLGAGAGRDAPDSPANARTQVRQVADRRGQQPARKNAGNFRLREDRCGRCGLRQGFRHERARLGARSIACSRACRRLRCGPQQGSVF